MQPDGKHRSVFNVPRYFNDAEENYIVIEKEALAICWGCDKFSLHLLGCEFTLEDRKHLASLLVAKELTKLPLRILIFHLHMMRYSPRVVYVLGKDQVTADALS